MLRALGTIYHSSLEEANICSENDTINKITAQGTKGKEKKSIINGTRVINQ